MSRGLIQVLSCRASSGRSRYDPMRRHADAQAVLVRIHASDRFTEHFADTVAAVGPRHDVDTDFPRHPVIADGVVGAREDDTLHAIQARRLEHVVGADDIVGQYGFPSVLARYACQVHDAIHVFERRARGLEIGDVDGQQLFAGPCGVLRLYVEQAQHRIVAVKTGAQRAADLAAGAGDQNAVHSKLPWMRRNVRAAH
jgi:hypothetical protein